MLQLVPLQTVDYLAIGHLTVDVTPRGKQLGGSAAYAALTARALGLRVGIVASFGADAPLNALAGVPLVHVPAEHTTTFENKYGETGRSQTLLRRAAPLVLEHIPAAWRSAPIVHLAPLAGELNPAIAEQVSPSFLGVTPQGWLRRWDESGRVSPCRWEDSSRVLNRAGAVILSVEDIAHNLELAEEMARETRLLCLTEGAEGATLYWNGDRRNFRPPKMNEADSTGAGDIFAAAFFTRLYHTRDPWEAARFATQLAARSVTRFGLDGIPTLKEIEDCLMEVIQ
ncbi:MAG: PfkB family carbohydrate kinase [Anaerolineales bacterium]